MSYSSVVLADTPKRWYRCNEAGGATTAVDGGSDNVTLTIAGTPTLAQPGALGLAGDGNKAWQFDGTDDEATTVTAPITAFANDGVAALTIECWVRYTNTFLANGEKFLFSLGNTATNSPVIGVALCNSDANNPNTGGGLELYFRDDGSSTIKGGTGTAHNDGQWHHVAITCARADTSSGVNGTGKIYVDGVLKNSVALVGALAALNKFGIGTEARLVDSLFFAGGIDEVAVYNTALSAARISAHYNAGRGQFHVGVAGGPDINVGGV